MRTEALAILCIIITAAAPTVAADPISRQEPHLPQFVSPAARADAFQSASDTNAPNEARQEAEALSGKFSDAVPMANSAASADAANVTDTAGSEVRDGAKMQGRVAILVAETSSDPTHGKNAKTSPAKPAAAVKKHVPPRMRVASAGKARATEHRQRPGARLGPSRNASMLASNEVPGAETGWQTGFIGFLTNPTFWH